jgi:hypothetical protein
MAGRRRQSPTEADSTRRSRSGRQPLRSPRPGRQSPTARGRPCSAWFAWFAWFAVGGSLRSMDAGNRNETRHPLINEIRRAQVVVRRNRGRSPPQSHPYSAYFAPRACAKSEHRPRVPETGAGAENTMQTSLALPSAGEGSDHPATAPTSPGRSRPVRAKRAGGPGGVSSRQPFGAISLPPATFRWPIAMP